MPEVVRTVGRYGILRELGRGGMAVVYLARHLDLDRLVALKELAAFHAADPTFARRFVRESRLAGSLVHPSVITVFDYLEHDGTPYIAMEYVERGSLRPYVGRMTLAQIGGVLEGLLGGLAAAEQLSIVHRDLKPENVMVTSAGGVKIADFGIAKATQAADTGAFTTATGTTVGTPFYMAPEQAMARDIGPWTDLYSVGCMAYELVTGRPPFHDTTEPMAIMLRHVTEPLPPAREVAGVDPNVSAWIERLTAKEPKERPASASVASQELEEILIDRLGPRWRRDAPLPESPSQEAGVSAPGQSSGHGAPAPVPGPATPPPSSPAAPIEGIDVEGTGPDTPEAMPSAVTPSEGYETYVAPPAPSPQMDTGEPEPPPAPARPAGPPPSHEQPARAEPLAPAEPLASAQPPPPAVPPTPHPTRASAVPPGEREPAAPERATRLARAGALALLAALLLPLLAPWPDRWNVFAVLSPLEAVGAAAATWCAARARAPAALVAGVLIGIGGLMTMAALGLLKFTAERLAAPSVVVAIVVLLGAGAILAAGVRTLRAAPGEEPAATADPAPLVLGLGAAALAGIALFVNYDGFSSLWVELQEGESAEFFLEPAIAAAGILLSLLLLGARPRLATGLLLAFGAATTLHYLGLLVAAWRAIGEVGEVRSAGFIGVLGGLLALAAGASAYRVQRASRDQGT